MLSIKSNKLRDEGKDENKPLADKTRISFSDLKLSLTFHNSSCARFARCVELWEGIKTNLIETLSQTAKNEQLSQPITLTAVLVTPRTMVELWQFSTVTALENKINHIMSRSVDYEDIAKLIY